MPFCTECGHQNPDDARFCSQCGTTASAAPARPRRLTWSRPASHRDDHLRRARAGGRAPRGALAQRGRRRRGRRAPAGQRPAGRAARPGAGSRFLLDTDVVDRRPAPRQRDLPRRRDRVPPARGVPPRGRRLLRSPTSAASTAPTSTATASTRSSSRTATRSRSASTGWSSSPATQEQAAGSEEHRRIRAGANQHRRGRSTSCAPTSRTSNISKIRFLEAEGLVEPERTPSGYRKFSDAGRRAAALRPASRSATTTCR